MIGPQGENLIFIISQPRAGSTLLQRILAGHPSIFATAEPWIMLHPLYALRDRGHTAEYNEEWARAALKDFCGSLEGGEQAYVDAVRGMGVSLYNNALRSSGRSCFLDKTPRYYLICPELRRTFPKARFILLLRNPLAVLSSVLSSWIKEDWERLDLYRSDLVEAPRLLDAAVQEFGGQAIVVRYEDLVETPEVIVRELCARLELPFEPRMIEYGNTPKPKGRMGDDVGIQRFTRPVPESRTKWVKELASPRRRLLAESYVAALDEAFLARLGYPKQQLLAALRSVPVDAQGVSIPEEWPNHAATYFDLPARTMAGLLQHVRPAAPDATASTPQPFACVQTSASAPAAPAAPADGPLRPAALQCVEEADRLFSAGNLAGAREWLERAIDLESGRSELFIALANVQSQTADLTGARASLARAAELRPIDPVIQVLLGSVCARLGESTEFETAVARALELAPGHPEAVRLLAGLNLQQGRYPDAARLFRLVLHQAPGDLDARLSLGKCLFESGERQDEPGPFDKLRARRRLEPHGPSGQPARGLLRIHRGQSASRQPIGQFGPRSPDPGPPAAPEDHPRDPFL